MKKRSLLKSFVIMSVLLLGTKSVHADPPTVFPDAPTRDAASVLSFFSDHYENITSFQDGTNASEVVVGETDQMLYVQSVPIDNWSYIHFADSVDISGFWKLKMNVYSESGTQDQYSMYVCINEGSKQHILPVTLRGGSWRDAELDFGSYRYVEPNLKKIKSIGFKCSKSRSIYVDNIYIYKPLNGEFASIPPSAAPTPKHSTDKVLSICSNFYSSPEDFTLSTTHGFYPSPNGDWMLYSENQGANTVTFTPVDVDGYDFIHLDIYSSAAFPLYFQFGGTGNKRWNTGITVTKDEWNSIDVALDDIKALDTDNVLDFTQLATFAYRSQSGTRTMYANNVYFYKKDDISVGLGNENSDSSEIRIYLNRVKDKICVESGSSIAEVKVINLTGAVVSIIKTDTNEIEINADNLNKGIYIIQVTMKDNRSVTQKILKL